MLALVTRQMNTYFQFGQFLQDESGQDIIEYALVLAFMALGTLLSVKTLASSIATTLGNMGTTISSNV